MIYLDNAATTSVHAEVLAQMQPFFTSDYGNPSSIHQAGRTARQAIENARRHIASLIASPPADIVFTSGGTEANHAALFGVFLATTRRHFVTTAVEHHAILHTLDFLRTLGAEVTIVQPNREGVIEIDDIIAAIRPDTACVSVMAVNNEMGSVQPIGEIAQAVKAHDPQICLHSDMIQALGTMRIDLAGAGSAEALHHLIDLSTFSAHKIHGPKGIGALYVRAGTPWRPVLYGGSQEKNRRAGTENVAGIVGFGAAVERLKRTWTTRMEKLHFLQQALWAAIRDIEGVYVNSPEDGVPTILNVGFVGVANDTLLMRLDVEGIAVSAGSACTAGSLEPSHVLAACGYPESRLGEAIRFSFSEDNSLAEIERVSAVLHQIIPKLRRS